MEIVDKLISWNFWLDMRTGQLMNIYEYTLIILIVLFLIFTSLFYLKKKNKKRKKNQFLLAWRQLYYFSITNTVLGGLIWFFNYQTIPFFSSRFWFVIWFLEMAIWLFFIIKLFKTLSKRIEIRKEKEQYSKYIS